MKLYGLTIPLYGALIQCISCGFNGDQKISTNDSMQYIVIRLEPIQQFITLCQQSNLRSDFESDTLYNKAVADCVFDKLELINAAQLQAFQNANCQPGADLSQYTLQQQSDIRAACLLLGGS